MSNKNSYNPPHLFPPLPLMDPSQQHPVGRLPADRFSDRLYLVAAGGGVSRLCRLERPLVAVHGLAAFGCVPVHVVHHYRPRGLAHGYIDRLRGNFRRAGNRVVGHADQPVALLHRRTSTTMDHPCLADCEYLD